MARFFPRDSQDHIGKYANLWHICWMNGQGIASRLRRLEELKGLLKAREHVTASELADELGVSLRTLNRDVDLLRESGVPVESDRGRGGGLRLQRNWSLGRLHLRREEAIDLLLSMAIAERMNSPLLLQQLASVRRKIVAAFSEGYQANIRSLRKRILIGAPASQAVMSSFTPVTHRGLTDIADAFFNMRCVRIGYIDQKGDLTTREVEPQFLYLNMPVWYLLSWDRMRKAVRNFRIDRIKSVTPLGATFRLADPKPFLADVDEGLMAL
jgi:predicted DNA-binding transcriptional regulator YafY